MMQNLRRLYTCLKKWSTTSMKETRIDHLTDNTEVMMMTASTRLALDDLYADIQDQRFSDPPFCYQDNFDGNFNDPSEEFMIARLGFHYVSL